MLTSHFRAATGTGPIMEHVCGFDRSQLYSDEGPPLADVGAQRWAETALEIAGWVLRWN